MKAPKKILIMALVGKENIGDEYILKAEYSYLKNKYPNAQFTIATFDTTSTPIVDNEKIQYISYFPNNLKKNPFKNIYYFFRQSWEMISNDLIIVGGGGIFFDNEPNVQFKKIIQQWKIRLSLSRLFRRKICFFGISLEILSSTNLRQLRQIMSTQDTLLVRNKKSKELLLQIGLNAIEIDDVVYLNSPTSTQLRHKKTIGIALRGGFFSEQKMPELKKFVEYLDEKGYKIIFVSHAFSGTKNHNDILFVESIFGKKYPITQSMQETEKVYTQIGAMISMRFHATILSAMKGIPNIILSYGPKTQALIDDFEAKEISIEVNSFSKEQAKKIISYLYSNYEKEQDKITSIYSKKHTKLLQKLQKIDIMDI